jgi:dethiobiotin synthetase
MANGLCGANRVIPLSCPHMKPAFFITGTDTGVGKTVLTALLAQFLRERGMRVAAFKPICSGGRDDARALHAALGGALTLNEINPWHFRAPIAPSLAAARAGKSVTLAQVLTHIRTMQRNFDVALVEGAGGLLSPLGKNFDSRDLMNALRARPIIVAPNKLGVVNHVLLTLEALPKTLRAKAKIVLMSPSQPDAATTSNAKLLGQFFPPKNIFTLPWLGENISTAVKQPLTRRLLAKLWSS